MSIFGKEARLLCRSLWWTMTQSQLSHQWEISTRSFVHNVDLNCRAMFKRPQFCDKYQGDRVRWYGFIQESHLKSWLRSLLLALSNQNKVFEPCYICMLEHSFMVCIFLHSPPSAPRETPFLHWLSKWVCVTNRS